jgi:hypothetical protein
VRTIEKNLNTSVVGKICRVWELNERLVDYVPSDTTNKVVRFLTLTKNHLNKEPQPCTHMKSNYRK